MGPVGLYTHIQANNPANGAQSAHGMGRGDSRRGRTKNASALSKKTGGKVAVDRPPANT